MSADAPVPGNDTWPAALTGLRFRQAVAGDADGLLALKKDLDHQTSFMLLEPEERSERSEDIAADLGNITGTNGVVIVAETGGQLAGYAEARGGRFRARPLRGWTGQRAACVRSGGVAA